MFETFPPGPRWETTTPFLDLHNHDMIYLCQIELGQSDPGVLQLRRRFETVSVCFYVEVKCGAYNPPNLGSKGPQHLSPL
jgi:hypothetical protein